ncbi:MAG: hypothetical protein ACUVV6_05385, partial [Thermoplasmatota archaeon]
MGRGRWGLAPLRNLALAALLLASAQIPPAAGVSELFTLSTGEPSALVRILVPPGHNSSASLVLPSDCVVLSAGLELSARALSSLASVSDTGPGALTSGGTVEGLSAGGGSLRLAELQRSSSFSNWSQRTGAGTAPSNGSLALARDPTRTHFVSNFRPGPSTQPEYDPVLAIGPGDELYIAWVDQREYDLNIYLTSSGDRGGSFSPAVRVNDDASGHKYLQDSPDVAVGPDGTVWVVWMDNRSGDEDIYMATSTDGGSTFSPNTRVDDGPPGTNQSHPSIAISGSGRVAVAWEDTRGGDRDIRCAFSDGGSSFGPSSRVNTDLSGREQLRPRLAADQGGEFHIVWYDNRSGDFDIYYARSQGASILPEIRVDSSGDKRTFQALPDVAVGPDGRVHVVWHDNGSGYFRVQHSYTQDGRTFSVSAMIDPPPGAGRDQYQPQLAIGGDGVIHVAWHDWRYGDPDIFYANSTNGGASFNAPVRVDDTAREVVSYSPVIGVDSLGEVHVAWQDNRTQQGGFGYMFQTIYSRGVHPYQSSGSWESPALDLGEAPARLVRASGVSEAPAGTKVELYVRSSTSDAGPWSEWAPAPAVGQEGSPPPARYIQWRVEMRTSTPSSTPAVRSLLLEYSVNTPSGVLTSRPIQLGERIRTATAYWVWGQEGGGPASLGLELSANNGSEWREAGQGSMVEFASPGRVLMYRFRFTGSSFSTPTLFSVHIDLRTESLPSELRLLVGRSTTSVWSRPGTLAEGEVLSSPELRDPLNRAVQEERRLGRLNATVALDIFSSTPGVVEIRSIRVVYDLPPLILSRNPSGGVELQEGGEELFSVEAIDPDSDALSSRWLLDGNQVASGALSFTYEPGYAEAGLHNLTILVSDGHLSAAASWSVTVRDVNRPPRVERSHPPSPVSLRTGETVRLEARLTDPDEDVLLLSWLVDGSLAATNIDYFDYTAPADPGSHILALNASDGKESVSIEWRVDVYPEPARPEGSRPIPWASAAGAAMLVAAALVAAAYALGRWRA